MVTKKSSKKQLKKVVKEIEKDTILTVPNVFTLSRLLIAFIFPYMLFSGYSNLQLTIVFAIGAITDLFDGYFARKLGKVTKLGARLDQVIDRIFTLSIVGSLLIYYGFIINRSIIPLILISSREILGLPAFILRIIKNKDPYGVRYIGKVTTLVQGIALAIIILQANWFGLNWVLYSSLLTFFIGIISGIDYIKDSLK